MPDKQLREIEWEDLQITPDQDGVQVVLNWSIGLLTALLVFAGASSLWMALRAEEPQRRYDWLNRCDAGCAESVSLQLIAGQQSCTGLQALYSQPNDREPLHWRLAVDDRATALGCPGFPKSLTEMRLAVEDVRSKRREQTREVTQQRREQADEREADVVGRYRSSLADGDLDTLVQYVSHATGSTVLEITLSSVWETQDPVVRDQVATVLWQKWANIIAPRNRESAKLIFYNQSGAIVGQSTALDSSRILWKDN